MTSDVKTAPLTLADARCGNGADGQTHPHTEPREVQRSCGTRTCFSASFSRCSSSPYTRPRGVASFALVPDAFAQAIHLDLSAASIENRPPEGLRINHLKAVGFPGTYRVDFQWDSTTSTFVPIPDSVVVENPAPPTDPILAKTELLKGHWHFVYTIISTFTNDYSLTTIPGTKNPQGGYYIHGTGQSGDPVVAAYFPTDGNWALLDPSISIDKFYTFLTDGQSILPGGCYYQINPPGSSNFSRCYALTGVKTTATTNSRAQEASGGTRLHGDEAERWNMRAPHRKCYGARSSGDHREVPADARQVTSGPAFRHDALPGVGLDAGPGAPTATPWNGTDADSSDGQYRRGFTTGLRQVRSVQARGRSCSLPSSRIRDCWLGRSDHDAGRTLTGAFDQTCRCSPRIQSATPVSGYFGIVQQQIWAKFDPSHDPASRPVRAAPHRPGAGRRCPRRCRHPTSPSIRDPERERRRFWTQLVLRRDE